MLQQEQEYYQGIPENEMETRYVYIYDEDPERRFHWRWPKLDRNRIGHLCMQLLAIVMLAGFCTVQGQPDYQIQTVRVPALPLHTCVINRTLRTQEHALSELRCRKQSEHLPGLRGA